MNWNELLAWMRNQQNIIRVNLEQGLIEEAAELARAGLHTLTVSRSTATRMGHGEEWEVIGEKLKAQYRQAREILTSQKTGAGVARPARNAPSTESESLTPQELRVKGEGLYHIGLYADALDSFMRAFKAGLREFDLVQQILECLVAEEKYREQVEFLEAVLKDQSLDVKTRTKLLFRLGNVQAHLNDALKARQTYLEVRRLDPHFPLLQAKLEALEGLKVSFADRYAYLVQSGRLNSDDLDSLRARAEQTGGDLDELLLQESGIGLEELGQSLSAYYNVPFVSFDAARPSPRELLSAYEKEPDYYRKAGWVPWGRSGDCVEVLMADPFDLNRIDEIRFIYGTGGISPLVALAADIGKYVDLFFAGQSAVAEEPSPYTPFAAEASLESDLSITPGPDGHTAEEVADPQILAREILAEAVRLAARDVHLEPRPRLKVCSVRYRIGGVCREGRKFPIMAAREVAARLKSMAGLDPGERRLPQDGRIRLRLQGNAEFLDLRVTSYPVPDNYEDIVISRVDMGKPIPLDRLGMLEPTIRRFESLLAARSGMILVVGPPGSGRSVTLHAALATLSTPERKILTVEDQITTLQDGARQVQLNPFVGLTYASALRTFLRSDPDIVMLGDLPDAATLGQAVGAVQSGVMILSSLLSRSAPAALTAMMRMGADPQDLAETVRGVLAQRMVRSLCPYCKESYAPSAEEYAAVVGEFGDLWESRVGLPKGKLQFYRPMGCAQCADGFKGRLALHELLTVSPALCAMLRQRPTIDDIRSQAVSEGMLTLRQDGVIKVVRGLTCLGELEQLVRV